MKIAITSTGDNLDSAMDERFGRCKYFIIADTKTHEYEAVENESTTSAHGTGIQVAQFVVDQNIKALITGNVGPNAMKVLQGANLDVYLSDSTTVKGAIEDFVKGKLEKAQGPTRGGH